MNINAAQVMALRDKTGVSMMAVKKALVESEGNEEKAIEILRKRGEMKSSEKADRATKEGVVAMVIKSGKGALVCLRCETDFVARNTDFIKLAQEIAQWYFDKGEAAREPSEGAVKAAVNTLGENIQLGEWTMFEAPVVAGYVHSNRKIAVLIGLSDGMEDQARDVAMHAAAMNPKVVAPEEVSAEAIAKEQEIWTEQLTKEGKPADKIPMIMKGKEKKFREDQALTTQAFVKDNSKTVGQFLGSAKIVKYARLAI